MSTIDVSPSLQNTINNNMFGALSSASVQGNSGNVSWTQNWYQSAAGDPCCIMAIMQGSVPSNFSTLTSFSARSSDVLVSFFPAITSQGDFSPSITSANPATISTVYKTATQAGTATWLWWLITQTQATSPYYNSSATLYHQMIGTVGATGSGADFIMSSTTISTSYQYRVLNLQIQLPTLPWTF